MVPVGDKDDQISCLAALYHHGGPGGRVVEGPL